MKKLLVLSLLLAGCSSEIYCWYPVSRWPSGSYGSGSPLPSLSGRTRAWSADEPGQMFPDIPTMEAFIEKHHLKLCGTEVGR